MTSFQAAAADRGHSWSVLIRIEGVGDLNGQWTFCSQIPTYATSSLYKPWLASWPDLVTERADPVGGVPQAGSVDFEIVDYNNTLTALFGMDQDTSTLLSSAVNTITPTVAVNNGGGIPNNTVIFIDAEAMLVTAGGGTNSLTVTRGYLGTNIGAHNQSAPVYISLPFLLTRWVTILLVPQDGDNVGTETAFGSYALDQMRIPREGNSYKFSARSSFKYLARAIPPKPQQLLVGGLPNDPNLYDWTWLWPPLSRGGGIGAANAAQLPSVDWGLGYRECWLKIGDMICRTVNLDGSNGNGGGISLNLKRGLLNTATNDVSNKGEVAAVVHCADTLTDAAATPPFPHCSFRWSPGTNYGGTVSTDRTQLNQWTGTSHPVDILLILLTSSFDPADGLELINYSAQYGNWSSLPTGYGAGVPMAQINLTSFLAVRDRISNYRIPNFYFGDKSEPLADIVSREILKPFGMYLTLVAGQLTLVLPRLPTQGIAAAATILADNVAREDDSTFESASKLPVFDVAYDGTNRITTIVYKVRARGGAMVPLPVVNGDYGGLYGPAADYAHDESALEIPFGGVIGSAGFSEMIYQMAVGRLYRTQKPTFKTALEVDFSNYAVTPGQEVAITFQGPPNFRTAARNWTARLGELLERAVRVSDDHRLRMYWLISVYADVKMGIIGPAAVTTSISSNVATCAANHYTDPGNTFGLPTTDVAGFAVNDVVSLANLDLSPAAAGTQIVQSVGSNTLTLDGNFGGALAANLILRYAGRGPASDPTNAQQNVCVNAGSDALSPPSIGATGASAFRWAEP